MKIFLIAFVAICAAVVAAAENHVVCYYGTWATYRPGDGKFDVENMNPNLCTHLIYTFFGIDDSGKIKSLDSYLDLEEDWGRGNIKKFNSMKSINRNLKTLAAVGGWNEGSVKFSNMARDATKRSNFITSSRDFLLKHGFDGLDMDWEYPAQREGASVDKANFVTLLKELQAEFKKHNLMITAAVAASEKSASQSYDIPQMSKYLDFIHVMTYDLHGAWDNAVGLNAPLNAGSNDKTSDEKQLNVVASIEYWLRSGAPASKLILGVPLYGRSFTLQDTSRTAPGSPSTGGGTAGPYTREAGMLGYNEICENLKQGGWTVKFDDTQKAPYAYKDRQWVGYDNEQNIELKGKYVKEKGLGGMMVWSIETDDFRGHCGQPFPLLQKINSVMRPGVNIPKVENPVTNPPVGGGDTGSGNTGSGNTGGSTTGGDSRCKTDGTFRDSKDCSAFYQCVGGYYYSFQCPTGLAFDLQLKNCNYKDQVSC